MKLDSPTLSPPLQVRIELNEERDNRARMQHTIAKLRNIIVAQANGQDAQGDPAAARFNPYIAAWYRKTNADQEFQQYPPKVGLPIMPLGVHTSATSAPLPVSYKWPLRLPPTAPCPGYWGGIRTPHPSIRASVLWGPGATFAALGPRASHYMSIRATNTARGLWGNQPPSMHPLNPQLHIPDSPR